MLSGTPNPRFKSRVITGKSWVRHKPWVLPKPRVLALKPWVSTLKPRVFFPKSRVCHGFFFRPMFSIPKINKIPKKHIVRIPKSPKDLIPRAKPLSKLSRNDGSVLIWDFQTLRASKVGEKLAYVCKIPKVTLGIPLHLESFPSWRSSPLWKPRLATAVLLELLEEVAKSFGEGHRVYPQKEPQDIWWRIGIFHIRTCIRVMPTLRYTCMHACI